MPNVNGQGAPRWVFRIDSRPPNVIFNQGFRARGTNDNFFSHVLGASLGDDLSPEEASAFVATSDSPDSALRFFGTFLHFPQQLPDYYLYQIRADERVYSAERTASRLLARLQYRTLRLEVGTYGEAYEAITAIFTDFAYQREWINYGNISPDRIRSAWRVDSVPIDPRHMRHRPPHGVPLFYTPRINDPEMLNPRYLSIDTTANPLPYDPTGDNLALPLTVSVPEQIAEADASGGVAASMSFACEVDPSNSKLVTMGQQSTKILESTYKHCYFDQHLVYKDLAHHPEFSPPLFSGSDYMRVFVRGVKTQNVYLLDWDFSTHDDYWLKLLPITQADYASRFIYDKYFRFASKHRYHNIMFSAKVINTNDATTKIVGFDIATNNDANQKFHFKKKDATDTYETWQMYASNFPGFTIFRKLTETNSRVYCLHSSNQNPNYEMLEIILSPNHTDKAILLPQESHFDMIDLGLSWFYQRQNYVPIPHNNTSEASLALEKRFFYDLNTYKIVHIDEWRQIYCLKNVRATSLYSWDWIQWPASDLSRTNDNTLRWYLVNEKWQDNFYNLNWRNIRSFANNDWLRVVLSGVNWGGFYTTNYLNDYNSIALFNLFPSVNI